MSQHHSTSENEGENGDLAESKDEIQSSTEVLGQNVPPSEKKMKTRKKKKKKKAKDSHEQMMEVEHPHELKVKDEVYIPGRSRPLGVDEELVMDKSAYRLFFQLQVESASLSFDILLDNLGFERAIDIDGEPISLCLLAGTQASHSVPNKLVLMRLNNLRPLRKKDAEKSSDSEASSDDDSDSSSDEDLDQLPEVEAATIRHTGTVNRVRACQFAGRYFAASWSEVGKVFVWDLTRPLTAINDSAIMAEYTRNNESPTPSFVFKGHSIEGYAMDWSSHTGSAGHLVTGDCSGVIHHWTPRASDWAVSPIPFTGHGNSVEDVQWSPTEPTVFISASSDRSIRVWDTRASPRTGSMLTVTDAHPSDVNVISWNRLNSVHLVSGGDEGSLRVWDLRLIHQNQTAKGLNDNNNTAVSYIHLYDHHSAPITSVEWHPNDAGVFAASSEDDQVTVWDITLEQDADTVDPQSSSSTAAATSPELGQLPVQLLFVHTGQTEIKELHWHPQLPGLLTVTALDGFNVFRTCNV